MKIDSDLIDRLERLAAIQPAGEFEAKLTRQLEAIVSYFEMIQRADTADQSAEAGSGEDAAAALRDDSLEPGLDHDQVMILAPESVEGFIRVPRIIDRE